MNPFIECVYNKIAYKFALIMVDRDIIQYQWSFQLNVLFLAIPIKMSKDVYRYIYLLKRTRMLH